MLWYIGTRAIAEAPQHLAIPASLKIFFRKRSLAVADDPLALLGPPGLPLGDPVGTVKKPAQGSYRCPNPPP